MKIERISDNMIKVTISLNDLEERNIDLGLLNYNSTAAQELLWDMMEQAEIECGFDMSDSQLIIEPMPDSEDGFIITITKIDEDGDFESIHKYIKSRFRRTDLRLKSRNNRLCSTIAIYCFQDLDDLIELCKRIIPIYTGDSSLYRLKNHYYLLLTRNSYTVSDLNTFDVLLNEYSTTVSNVSFYEGYLNEYGEEIIADHAVETVVDYF